MRVRVVGLTFGPDGEHYARRLYRAIVVDEAPLSLERRPGDGGDPWAIAVRRDDTGEHFGYLRSSTAKMLAPHLDAGELWVVTSANLQISHGHEHAPGLMVIIRRVDWAEDPPIPVSRLGDEKGPSRPERPRPDIRAWAKRSVEMAAAARLRATRVSEDLWAVPSGSQEGRWYAVAVDTDPHCLVHLLCHCRSAACRPDLPVACRHAGAVVREMERRGDARVIGSLAYRLPSAAHSIA